MPSLYILNRSRGGIKVGYSINPAKRLSELQQATPERLAMVWCADFGEQAVAIEGGTKRLLAPWRIRGEWFDTDPLMAGLAIEAARDDNAEIIRFLARMAACYRQRPDYMAEDRMDAEVERDFPAIYARLGPLDPGDWTDWRGKTHKYPHRKFTRVIVSGMPETTYGCPQMPQHIQALENYRAQRAKKS